MCIRDRLIIEEKLAIGIHVIRIILVEDECMLVERLSAAGSVSYTHLRAHETVLDLVCRLLLEKKNKNLPS